MRIMATILLLGMLLADRPDHVLPNREPGASASQAVQSPRFVWVDAYIDPRGQPLAAYQFELRAQGADVTLVGVEGGEHPAFTQPPYYDPKANLGNRIVIAAYNAGDDLPRGRTRVARVMIRVSGSAPPSYSARLDVAVSPRARPIDAQIEVSEGAAQ